MRAGGRHPHVYSKGLVNVETVVGADIEADADRFGDADSNADSLRHTGRARLQPGTDAR